MENMIKRIVDADNEAKALESDALKEKDILQKQIDEEAQKIYDKYMSEAQKTVERNDAYEEKEAQMQAQLIENKQKSAHIKLQSDFKLNFDKWVDAIVSRTLE